MSIQRYIERRATLLRQIMALEYLLDNCPKERVEERKKDLDLAREQFEALQKEAKDKGHWIP